MLTFSVNKDIRGAVQRLSGKFSENAQDFERAYWSYYFINEIDNEDRVNKKVYANAAVYAMVVDRNKKREMLARPESSIVTSSESSLGYRGIREDRLIESRVLDNLVDEHDDYANTETVDTNVDRSFNAHQWYDVCDLAVTDFGLNLMKCLKVSLESMSQPILPFELKLRKLGYKYESYAPSWAVEIARKEFNEKIVKTLHETVRHYGVEDMLKDILMDKRLRDKCLDEVAYTAYGYQHDEFIKPDYEVLRKGNGHGCT
jgi:hypothetical protein